MGRGSVQLRHRKGCQARGKEPRACRCAPTVYVVLGGQWAKVGFLEHGWRQRDLAPFDDRLVEMRARFAAGEAWQPKKVLRLVEYADRWFDDLHAAAEAGRVSKLTFNTYEGLWANHLAPAFGALPLAAIDAATIRRYVNAKLAGERCECGRDDGCAKCRATGWRERPLAPVTVNATLTPLSAMLTDAVAEGYLPANPARQPRRARHGGSRRNHVFADVHRADPKFLELDEARALLAATSSEYRPMGLAALTTGARRGELLALRWENVDFAKDRVRLVEQLQGRRVEACKYDSAREVPLYSGLAAALGPRRQATGLVFMAADGQPWANDGPGRAFLAEAYEVAGLRRPRRLWHVLRHTYASALAAGGVRRDVVERLMGHAGKGTTSLYTHLFSDAFEGVEAALEAAFGVNETSTARSVPKVPEPGAGKAARSGDSAPRRRSRTVLDGAGRDT